MYLFDYVVTNLFLEQFFPKIFTYKFHNIQVFGA